MSMQTHDGVGEPASGGIVRWRRSKNAARDARRLRLRQEIAEAERLGVVVKRKPPVDIDRYWTPEQDAVVRENAADLDAICRLLPGRTRKACMNRRKALGLMPEPSFWTNAEERAIREGLKTALHARDLLPRLPGRSIHSVRNHLIRMGLKVQPAAPDTGNTVVDAILARCRLLKISGPELDRMAATGRFFGGRHWKHPAGRNPVVVSDKLSRAVTALGGELRVEWPD